MTATAAPPRPTGDPSGGEGRTAEPTRATPASTVRARHRTPSLFVWSEITLASVTVVTVAGLWRLFIDGSFVVPLMLHAVAAHTVAAMLRRRGVGLLASAGVVAVCAFFAICWGHLGHTTAYGIPIGDTAGTAWDRLTEAWHGFGDVKAPAPVLPGFMLALAAVVWVIGWAADTAAFRIWAPFEALIPAGTLFVFASLFAADENRLLAAALWLASALTFVLVQRTARQQSSPSWLGSDPVVGTRALLRGGAFLGLVAIGLTLLGSQRLPGYGEAALLDLDPDRGASRQTVSPLVEIQGRLLEQSDTELFSVTTAQRAYWRLTSLDIFDGNVWSSRGSFGRAEGELEGVPEELEGSVAVTQSIEITGLSAIWVPAAFEPRAIEVGDVDVRWEPESSTLIVSTELPTSDGLIYDVTSAVPSYEPDALRAADGHIPRTLRARNIDLPPEFPRSVTDEARRVVAGATTPYDQARALQDYFRSGNFTYSLSAPSGHSDTAIESFLFDTRTGYCEQFAGTYAAMARAIGLPARVAVGFTPGERDPLEPERYVVRGEHAHAWPEVYIAGVGWVAFEPTPGRGAPGAQSYTGVPEEQDTPGASTEPILSENPGPQFPTEQGAGAGAGELGSTTTLPLDPLEGEGAVTGTPVDEGVDGRDLLRYMGWFVLGLLALTVLVVAVGCAVAAVRALRRLRRRIRATSAEDKVRVAWAEAVESVEVLGVTPRRFETPLEFARRIGAAVGAGRPGPLAGAVEQADFAPAGVTDDEAVAAAELSHEIKTAVRHQTTARQRLLAAVDPRPPERRGRHHAPRPSGPRIQIRAEA